MLSLGTFPDTRTALNQTPANPNPFQLLRLVEALYYNCKAWTDSESAFPATFDQLHEGQAARYYQVAQYLLARRTRVGPVSEQERQVHVVLDRVLAETPCYLFEAGSRELSERNVAAWLRGHFAFTPAQATEVAQRWVALKQPA